MYNLTEITRYFDFFREEGREGEQQGNEEEEANREKETKWSKRERIPGPPPGGYHISLKIGAQVSVLT